MGPRFVSFVSVIILFAIAMAPAVADDSDAANTARMSDSYILTTTAKYVDGLIFREDCRYFKTTNTEGIAEMESLLEDHIGVLPEDDRSALSEGDVMKIYYATMSQSLLGGLNVPIHVRTATGIEDYSKMADLDKMVLPYSPGFFVKAGDRYSIRILEATDSYGKSVVCSYTDGDGVYHDLSETYSGRMKTTTEFVFDTDSPSGANGRFFVDLVYESTGFSSPSGSAAVFAALCASVTIAIFCILAYAGLKPKWSR